MGGYLGPQPVPQAVIHKQRFPLASGQTSVATAGYIPGYVNAWLNGQRLDEYDDFTATNGSDVVLTVGGSADGLDVLVIEALVPFQVLNQYFTGTTKVDSLTSLGTVVAPKILSPASSWTPFADIYTTSKLFSIYKEWGNNTNTISIGLPSDSIENIRFDSAGRVTMPNQPRFCGQRSNGNVTNAYILLNSVRTNIGNCYNTSTGRFTCPVAGVYRISFFIPMSTTNSYLRATRNGGIVAEVYTGFEKPVGGHTVLEQCAANDYIEFYVEGTTNGTYATNYNSVSIELA